MRTIVLAALLLLTAICISCTENKLLQSGPMLGYSQMREVAIWIQTTEEANVRIQYWQTGDENSKKSWTDEIKTSKNNAYACKLFATDLEPGLKYEYAVYIDGQKLEFDYPLEFQTQKLWQWRTDPPEIKFAIASCFYVNETQYDRPGKLYGGNYEILNVIYEKQPEFMVWMGDDIYLREVDWNARSSILKRYTHTRSLPELQPLLASTHHYATWDDHDFGPNNSDRSFWNKQTTLECFKLFWANPSFGINGTEGVTTYFQWGDLDFFLLDDRYFRSPENRETTNREILGEGQVEWLIDNLTSSNAPFKFVVIGTQFLNPNAGGENHSNYPKEREKILKMIEQEKISGVIFLTGDVHRSELTKLKRKNNYPLYEFTISPLIAGPSRKAYSNDARVEGTVVLDRSFGIFNVTGPRKDRTLTCKVFDWQGTERWAISINENELRK